MEVSTKNMEIDDLLQRVVYLESQVDQLRNSTSERTIFTTPVDFINKEGIKVFSIGSDEEGGFLHLHNSSGKLVLSCGSTTRGAFVDVINSVNGNLALTLEVRDVAILIEIVDRDGESYLNVHDFLVPTEKKSDDKTS